MLISILIFFGLAFFLFFALSGSANSAAAPGDDEDDDLWTNPDRWLDRAESHPPGRDDWLK
jgi:hypothetical protein